MPPFVNIVGRKHLSDLGGTLNPPPFTEKNCQAAFYRLPYRQGKKMITTGPDEILAKMTNWKYFTQTACLQTLRQISSSAPSHQLSHNLKQAERVLTRVSSLGASLLVGNKADLVKMRRVKQGGGIFLTYCTGVEVIKVLQHFVSWANSSTQSILRHHQVSIVFSAIGFCNLHWYRQIQSKHLKCQLDPPVACWWRKVCVFNEKWSLS